MSVAAVLLSGATAAWMFAQQPAAGGEPAAKGKAKAKESRPVEPAPRWPDGHVNLGAGPGHKGYWELRPGFAPRVTDVPFQPWAKELYAFRQKSQKTARPPYIDCKAAPGPEFLLAPGFEIVEAPDLKSVFIINIGGPHSWRVIYMDGRPHPKPEDLRPTYMGHSIGHWEGETLVVDTIGINEKVWLMGSYPTTEKLHITEKFSRPTLGSLVYELTIDDPGAYTAPWGGRTQINETTPSRWVPNGDMFEYICQDDR